jgi:hypothetical protein
MRLVFGISYQIVSLSDIAHDMSEEIGDELMAASTTEIPFVLIRFRVLLIDAV